MDKLQIESVVAEHLAKHPAFDPHPFSHRRPRVVLPLVCFDVPPLHRRSEFHASKISALIGPRKAGSAFKFSPDEIRDEIHHGNFSESPVRAYLRELFHSMDGLDVRVFYYNMGISFYELARAMIACRVRNPFIVEWMNCRSPYYTQPERESRRYWVHWNLGRARLI